MNQPLNNPEKNTELSVGKDAETSAALSVDSFTKADSIAKRKASGGIPIPRGVYRFKTHEEANEWMDRMLARRGKPNT